MRVPYRIATAVLAGVMALSLAAAASAAKPQKRQQARGAVVAPPVLLEKLNLTEDQQAKIKTAAATLKEDQQKAQSLTTPKEKRQAVMAARDKYQATLNATLNAEQQKSLQAMMETAREYKSMGPLGMQLVGIDLTSDQKEKIQAIGAKYEPEMAKLRASQKDATDKKAVRAQIQDLNRKLQTEVRAVLTPEQQKQLAPARQARKNKP